MPYNWISDLTAGTVISHRDVACQFYPNRIQALARIFPQAGQISALLQRGHQVIVLSGQSAVQVATILTDMGNHRELDRLIDLLEIIRVFVQAPSDEWSTMVNPGYEPDASVDTANRINQVLAYINSHIAAQISLDEAAEVVSMSPSAFSRFFKRAAGINFSDMVRRLRISRASRLLVTTDLPIASIRARSRFGNVANFNRRFKQEMGTTPRAYRQSHRY